MSEKLAEYLTLAGPLIVGMLTVPVMAGIKRITRYIGTLPAPAQQLIVVTISFLLTWIGQTADVILPASLDLFSTTDVNVLLSSSIALAIHAGKKKKVPGSESA